MRCIATKESLCVILVIGVKSVVAVLRIALQNKLSAKLPSMLEARNYTDKWFNSISYILSLGIAPAFDELWTGLDSP